MQIPMFYLGERCGAAGVDRQGLYYEIRCACDPVTDDIVRAWAEWDGGRERLGVLVPEEGQLRLRRRIPVSSFSGREIRRIAVETENDGWTAWAGELHGCTVADALTRTVKGERLVAMPFSTDEPFAYMPLFRLCTPVEIQGRRYLALPLPAGETGT